MYLASWHETAVACKVLVSNGGDDLASSADAARAVAESAALVQKVEEEAGLLASLRHPNIVAFCAWRAIVRCVCVHIVS